MKILPILIVFLIFSGCSAKIATRVTFPARHHEATSLKRLAVLDFEGNSGRRVSSEIENILTNVIVSGRRYFTVMERKNLDKIISEQQLQTSGITDETSIVKFGKIIGVEGIYTGTANVSFDDSTFTENRTKCIETNKKGKCTKWADYQVSCIKRTLMLSVTPKLINIGTGNIVYANLIEKSASDSRCSDSSTAISSPDELFSKAMVYVMSQFRKDVAPYSKEVFIELLENNDGIPDAEGETLLKSSLEFAKKDRMDRACELWKQGILKYPMSMAFNYNCGICSEIEGDFETALSYYKKADGLSLKPVKQITNSLIRIKSMIDNREKLKKQL